MINLPVINTSPFELPNFETLSSSGLDLRANIKSSVYLKPFQRVLVPTGIKIALPKKYEGQIRPRSGLALKHGITVLNSPGTIDADYRGELGVILINLSDENYKIKPGDRIAQLVISNFTEVKWKLVQDLGDSERGELGFGSTGFN